MKSHKLLRSSKQSKKKIPPNVDFQLFSGTIHVQVPDATVSYTHFKQSLSYVTKNSSNKMLPQWGLNLDPLPFRSDAFLSELARQLTFVPAPLESLIYIIFVRINRAWLHKDLYVPEWQPNANLVQQVECQTWIADIPDSFLTGSNILLLEFFVLMWWSTWC